MLHGHDLAHGGPALVEHVGVPRDEGQRVDVGVHRRVALNLVGHRVVGVVLVVPPGHAETLIRVSTVAVAYSDTTERNSPIP